MSYSQRYEGALKPNLLLPNQNGSSIQYPQEKDLGNSSEQRILQSERTQSYDQSANLKQEQVQEQMIEMGGNDRLFQQEQMIEMGGNDRLFQQEQMIEMGGNDGLEESEKKCVKVYIFIIILTLGSVLVILFTIIFSPQHRNDFVDRDVIVERNFTQNKVYKAEYMVLTDMNDTQVRVNYTVHYVVVSKNEENSETNFLGSIQKRSEEKIDDNQTDVKYFDTSDEYEDILKHGIQQENEEIDLEEVSLEDLEDLMDSTEPNGTFEGFDNTTNITGGEAEEEGEELKSVKPYIPVFGFTISKAGNIQNMVFPEPMEKELLGLLVNFIRMFSPITDKNAYDGKVHRTRQSSRLMTTEAEEDYGYEKTDESTTLQKKGSYNNSANSHNSQETMKQKSKFDKNGELEETTIEGNTTFSSVPEEPNENYSTLNSDIQLDVYQKSILSASENYTAPEDNVDVFKEFLGNYEENNKALSMTCEEINDYIIGNNENEEERNGTRLLLQDDGSITLLNNQMTVFTGNFIGLRVGSSGYTAINLKMEEDKKNIFQRTPVFRMEAGVILYMGFFTYAKPLIDYEKKFPPLTLKFTLEQVEGVFKLFKYDFIGQIKDIKDIILDGSFENNLLPKIFQVLDLLDKINAAIDAEQNSNSPVAILQKIFSAVADIQSIIETKGLDSLNPQNEFAKNLTAGLLDYVNVSYAEALNLFENAKGQLDVLENEGSDFLITSAKYYTEVEVVPTQELLAEVIPPDLLADYEQQIQKAKDILQFLRYVKQEGLQYKKKMEEFHQNHKEHFLNFSRQVIDAYFLNQTFITDAFLENVTNRLAEVTQYDVELFQEKLNFILEMNQKIQSYFRQILDSSLPTYTNEAQFVNLLVDLGNIANGVSHERGPACCRYKRKWYGKKYCAIYNAMYGPQAAEPGEYSAMRSSIEIVTKQNQKAFQNFNDKVQQIISNSSLTVPEKFEKIQNQYALIFVSQLNQVVDKVRARKDRAYYIAARKQCGGWTSINNYRTKLSNLLHRMTYLRDSSSRITNKYNDINRDFIPDVYKNIVDNGQISARAKDFFSNYEKLENITQFFIQDLDDIADNYDPENFVSSIETINTIFILYDDLGDSLQELCSINQAQATAIQQIKEGYQNQLDRLSNLTDPYLNEEIQELMNFLATAANQSFATYETIPFCAVSQFYQEDIRPMLPELENLTMILDMYNSFTETWSHAQKVLGQLEGKMLTLKNRFLYLHKAYDYRQFLEETFELAKDMMGIVYKVSMEMSTLKQEAQSIFMLNIGEESDLHHALASLTSAEFPFSSREMFSLLFKMKRAALDTVDQLSFEIITVVVLTMRIKDHVGETISTLNDGTSQIKDSFTSLCRSFIDLDALVTQDYLNQINRDFRNIIHVLNDTVFPNVEHRQQNIIKEFMGSPFRSKKLRNIFTKCFGILTKFSKLTNKAKENMFSQMQEINKQIVELVNTLEIGSLNSVFELANIIQTEFEAFFSSFPSLIHEVLNFQNLVSKDFKQLFSLKGFLKSIQRKIQGKYQSSVGKIFKAIKKSDSELAENSNFYEKFVRSEIHKELAQSPNKFKMNHRGLWRKANPKLTEIDEFMKEISGNVESLLKELSDAKNKMSEIRTSVNQRIENIKNEFSVVKRKMFNFLNLVFIAIRGELGGTVMSSLNKILEEMDKIVEEDLGNINVIANSKFAQDVNYIKVTLKITFSAYEDLKNVRNKFVRKIKNGLARIDKFIESIISTKFQKLKDALVLIKSKTNLDDPTQSIVLYQRSLYKKRVPIFKLIVIIPTIIGTFVMGIDITYFLGISGLIEIEDFRHLRGGLRFQASLDLQIFFGYGIAYILEFGFYVRGRVLSGSLYPAVSFNNMIPIQLVEPLTGMSEFEKGNKISAWFTTDLALRALQIEIGFYIKHIWIEIIWLHIRICFRFFWFKFCIAFKIPIGFRFIFKRHDFGYVVKGIELFRKRIFQIRLL